MVIKVGNGDKVNGKTVVMEIGDRQRPR